MKRWFSVSNKIPWKNSFYLVRHCIYTQVLTKPTYQAVKPHHSPNCRHQTFTIYPTWKSVKLCFYSWGRQDFEFWPLSKKDKDFFSRECFLFITGRERREDSHQRLCSPIKQIRIKKFLSFKRIPLAHLEKSANLRKACFSCKKPKNGNDFIKSLHVRCFSSLRSRFKNISSNGSL